MNAAGSSAAGGGGGAEANAPSPPRKTSFCEHTALLQEDQQQQNGGLCPAALIDPHEQFYRERRPTIHGSTFSGIHMNKQRRRSSVVREKWASKLEFLLAVIGYAVDLGTPFRSFELGD